MTLNRNSALILSGVSITVFTLVLLTFLKFELDPLKYIKRLLKTEKLGSSLFSNIKESSESSSDIYLIANLIDNESARRMIYKLTSSFTKFSGEGRITEKVEEVAFVSPKGEGRPFFTFRSEIAPYANGDYDITFIPAQDKLMYVVGEFVGWEDIKGSQDKYLVLKYLNSKNIEKFRVSFEQSDLYKDESTLLSIEFILNSPSAVNLIKPFDTRLIEMGYGKLSANIKQGDAVILTPVFEAPYYAKTDTAGNVLVYRLILRRGVDADLIQLEK